MRVRASSLVLAEGVEAREYGRTRRDREREQMGLLMGLLESPSVSRPPAGMSGHDKVPL